MYAFPSFTVEQMRIQNIGAVRDGIVYIGHESGGQYVPYGTGFLICVVVDSYRFIFVVTAAHVIAQIPGETVYVRLNRKVGDAASVPVKSSSILGWDENDIAIMPLSIGNDVFDYKALVLSEEQIAKGHSIVDGISYGDEVYAIGLYTSHHGLTRNIPVVRVGHVALLPGEPVRGPGGYVSAYLVELRTIAGLSGSPVYLNPPQVRVKNKKVEHLNDPVFLPIGVLVGYHVVESKEDQIAVSQFQAREGMDDEPRLTDSLDQRNTGFGVVIPIERVLEMMKGTEPMIKAAIERAKAEVGFKPASVSSVASDASPTHREDFNRLLDVASKTPPSKD